MPMTEEQKASALRKLEMSVKYDMFTTFDDGTSVDDGIMALSDYEFEQITQLFLDKIEYLDAVTEAEGYVRRGMDVPKQLWNSIVKTRETYLQYRS